MKRLYLLLSAAAMFGLIAAGACSNKAEEAEVTRTKGGKVVIKDEGKGIELETEGGTVNIKNTGKGGKVDVKTKDGTKLKLSY